MKLQFCDKCGKPLSEGCLARGEAIEREGELVCAHCIAVEQAKRPEPAPVKETGPLGQYGQSVWSCESCGIPVTALDLIEGRGSRVGGVIKCSRCAPIAADKPEPRPAAAARPRVVPGRMAPITPRASSASGRPASPELRKPAASLPRASQAPAENYFAAAKAEQRRPIVPIIVFATILPMFAVSLFYAVNSQLKLNEVMAERGNEQPGPERRPRRPVEQLEPDNAKPAANQPAQPGPSEPEPPPAPGKKVLSPDVIDDLVAIERDLAEPAIAKLQSKDLAEVWEGLLEAGSRRLVAARPYVRGLLGDNDDQTRVLACRVCGMLSDKEALLKLTRMAEQDPNEAVRIEARKARDRLTGEATRDIRDLTDAELEEMLRDLQRELERRKGRRD